MGHEREIKLRIEDVRELRARLAKFGARPVFAGTGRVHEWNVLFDTPDQILMKRRALLRIRTETSEAGGSEKPKGQRVLVTHKRPIRSRQDRGRGGRRRHKVREEIELEVSNAAALARIFEGLGLRPWFRYEKYRTTFRLGKSQAWASRLLIEVDETPIGAFMELEGPERAIDRAAKQLGFQEKDYIVSNYFSLYRMECERRKEKVRDMIFTTQRSKVQNG